MYILEFSCRYPSTDDRLVAWIVQFKLALCFLALFTMSGFCSKCQAKVDSGMAVSGPLDVKLALEWRLWGPLDVRVAPKLRLWCKTGFPLRAPQSIWPEFCIDMYEGQRKGFNHDRSQPLAPTGLSVQNRWLLGKYNFAYAPVGILHPRTSQARACTPRVRTQIP